MKIGVAHLTTKSRQPLCFTEIFRASLVWGSALGSSLHLDCFAYIDFIIGVHLGSSGFIICSEGRGQRAKLGSDMSVGRGMANHHVAVGVYYHYCRWTYIKSLEVSESVEKVTFRNLGAEENTNCDSQKGHFDKIFHCLPDLCLLL